jgi:multidrug efflux pump subunit AcrA (membrane-fusion protein)
MLKRQITIILAAVIFVGGFIISKSLGNKKKPSEKAPVLNTLKIGSVKSVTLDTITTTIPFTGKLIANQKIDVYSEVQGILRNNQNDFKEGNTFDQGDILLNIDSRDTQMALAAQRSGFTTLLTQLMPDIKMDYSDSFDKWNNYLSSITIDQSLPELPEISSHSERNFITAKNIINQYYSIKSAEVKLSKYLITAPFSGVVTSALVTEGTNVRPGQKMGEFAGTDAYELETSIPIKDIGFLKKSGIAKLYSNDIPGNWSATIKRIGNNIDENTQSVKVYLSVKGDTKLKEGMYLSGNIQSQTIAGAIEIPTNLISEESIFTLDEDSILRLIPVNIIKNSDKTTIIKGVKNNTTILYKTIPGSYDGMKISPVVE